MKSVNGQHVIPIGGVKVLFPFQDPYPGTLQLSRDLEFLKILKNFSPETDDVKNNSITKKFAKCSS